MKGNSINTKKEKNDKENNNKVRSITKGTDLEVNRLIKREWGKKKQITK